ncbi:MAG: OmpA family protein [SAR324 cluster bacterium]|nr:OmpA family protein [SAR324 cluster bacterium]
MKTRVLIFSTLLCITVLTTAEASEWFPVPQFMSEPEIAKVYQGAVRSQIIEQKGVRNTRGSSSLELDWLKQVAQSEREWQMTLQELERGYRRALSEVIHRQTEHQSRLVLVIQYDNRIATLEAEIRELEVRSQQIAADRQRYEQGLDNLPLATVAVVKALYTEELAGRLKESGYEDPMFRKAGEVALKTMLETYSTQSEIPFQQGRTRVSFLYPENISRFDDSANEYVYLFPIIEVNPFAQQEWALAEEMPGVTIQSFISLEQAQAYLKQEQVGDARLSEWIEGELGALQTNNAHVLQTINGALQHYEAFRKGLAGEIGLLQAQIGQLQGKRDELSGKQALSESLVALERIRQQYRKHYEQRVLLGYEEYTMEFDVMFSGTSQEQRPRKTRAGGEDQGLMVRSQEVVNIPVSGRPLKDIYADMILSANGKASEAPRIPETWVIRVKAEDIASELLQGKLRWGIDREEFRLLQLSRRSIGSRTQYRIAVAKRMHLLSEENFPPSQAGVCEFTVFFKPGNLKLSKNARQVINENTECLLKYPRQLVQLTGHTDGNGKVKKGDNYVKQGIVQATAVMDYLVSQGFDPDRIVLASKGASMLPNDPESSSPASLHRVEVISRPEI